MVVVGGGGGGGVMVVTSYWLVDLESYISHHQPDPLVCRLMLMSSDDSIGRREPLPVDSASPELRLSTVRPLHFG